MTRKLTRFFLLLIVLLCPGRLSSADDSEPQIQVPFQDDPVIQILIEGDGANIPEGFPMAEDFQGCFWLETAHPFEPWGEIGNDSNAVSDPIDLVRLGESIWRSPVASVVKPRIVELVQSGYRALTWDGVDVSAELPPVVDVAPMMSPLPATFDDFSIFESLNGLLEEPLADSPAVHQNGTESVSLPGFDVEREIHQAWLELEFGIAPAKAPVPYQSRMDRYWQYYSDCDRWGVVFTDATEHWGRQPSGEYWNTVWQQVDRWMRTTVSELNHVRLEIWNHFEFETIETEVPKEYQRPLLQGEDVEYWLFESAAQIRSGGEFIVQWLENVRMEPVIAQWAEKLAQDRIQLLHDQQKKQASAYLAPRLNWLSRAFGAAAKRLELSTEVAGEKSRMK